MGAMTRIERGLSRTAGAPTGWGLRHPPRGQRLSFRYFDNRAELANRGLFNNVITFAGSKGFRGSQNGTTRPPTARVPRCTKYTLFLFSWWLLVAGSLASADRQSIKAQYPSIRRS